jgi:preprotein translocase subunit YajC
MDTSTMIIMAIMGWIIYYILGVREKKKNKQFEDKD